MLEEISAQTSIENYQNNKTNPYKGLTKKNKVKNTKNPNDQKTPKKSRVARCNNRNPAPIDGKCPIDKPKIVTMKDGTTKCCYKKIPKTPKVSTSSPKLNTNTRFNRNFQVFIKSILISMITFCLYSRFLMFVNDKIG